MPFIDLPDRIPGLRAQAREPRSWYRITNQAADEAEVMLYDEVGGWLGATADEFINDLRGITAPNILLRVNSPGGQVYEGIAIANALRSHPANVTVQVDGLAASIASVIAMAGDRVRMMPNAMLMLHEASGLTVGNAADHRETAELLDKISGNIADAYAARAGGTRDEWRQVMVKETWYTAEEAVEAGLADEAVQVPQTDQSVSAKADEPDMARAFDLAAYGYAGPRAEQPDTELALQTATLSEDIRSLIGDEVAAQLRAAVDEPGLEQPAEPEPEQPQPAEEPAPVPESAAEPEPEVPAEDAWAATVAHLTQDDAWSAVVSRLTSNPASSRAATDA